MQYVKFGKKGLEVSRFAMGCMRLPLTAPGGAPPGSTTVDEAEAIRMIRHAADNGVNYFDTAYGYHNGTSEVILGKALQNGYREKVKVATKLPGTKYDEAASCFEEQISKLQIDHLDVYLLHGLNKNRWPRVKELKLLSLLDKLKAEGRITCAGFSFHDGPDIFREIIDAYDWDMCQIQFNYVDENFQAGIEGLKYAASKGISVVVMEPLKGGVLAQNVPDNVRETFDSAPFKRTPAEWGLRWVADIPEVTVVLSGVSSMEQLKENIEIFSSPLEGTMTEEEAKLIRQVKAIYDSRIKIGCTACGYCMPCPSGVNIPNIFKFYNAVAIGGKIEQARKSYARQTQNKADATFCTECGQCEEACPQNLEIIEGLKQAHALLG
jgi:predicted aldo/keto reductase-like oxidoreductase